MPAIMPKAMSRMSSSRTSPRHNTKSSMFRATSTDKKARIRSHINYFKSVEQLKSTRARLTTQDPSEIRLLEIEQYLNFYAIEPACSARNCLVPTESTHNRIPKARLANRIKYRSGIEQQNKSVCNTRDTSALRVFEIHQSIHLGAFVGRPEIPRF